MSTTISRRTALIGGTGAVTGSMFFAGSIFARQESTPETTDLDSTFDDMDPSRILEAAANAVTIVETDRAAWTPVGDTAAIDELIQRGSDVITAAAQSEDPRRQALGGVALLAAAHTLLMVVEDVDLPSRAGSASRVMNAASTAMADMNEAVAGGEMVIDPDAIETANSLYAAAYDNYMAGSFSPAAREAQAAALVAAGVRILAGEGDALPQIDGDDAEVTDEPRWRRIVNRERGSGRLALAAPMVALLRPIAVVEVNAPVS